MSKFNLLFLLIIFLPLMSCEKNHKTQKDIVSGVITSELISKREDSTKSKLIDNKLDYETENKKTQSILNGGNLKTDDYIKKYPAKQSAELRRHIDYLRKAWQNVPNPITATYQGNDFGDYHHIIFKAKNGAEYDFGQAKNNYEPYKLHKLSGQFDDNHEFLGKEFKVYWDWKLTNFLCCDGEYGKAKAYLPTIIKLELIKK